MLIKIKKYHNNYKRYLINSFRSALGLKSIQLRLLFRKADNPYKDNKNILSERQIKKRQRLIKHNKRLKSKNTYSILTNLYIEFCCII